MQTTGIQNSYYNRVIEIPYAPEQNFALEDFVVFQDEEKQEEIGTIVFMNQENRNPENIMMEAHILRKATPNDIQKDETNKERSKEAVQICLEKIIKLNLPMRLTKVDYSFSGARMNFQFTAENRVDFRELVKDLAQIFKKQIHLQQIGPRDRAKQVIAFGKCGQQTCCTRYLTKFESITMDMVREQNLENRGSDKLSGLCGKLLCCLKYEVLEYQRLKAELPAIGSLVKTKYGSGKIINLDVLNKKIRLEMTGEPSRTIAADDILD